MMLPLRIADSKRRHDGCRTMDPSTERGARTTLGEEGSHDGRMSEEPHSGNMAEDRASSTFHSSSLERARVDRNEEDKRPVLVTGMHRSGTSWLGAMLSASGEFINVQEPLSVQNRQTILRSLVKHWYTYICDTNEDLYLPFYRDALAFRMHPLYDVQRMRVGSPRDPVRIPKRWASFVLGRVQRRRLLIRDPFAALSIEWFSRRLGVDTVAIVRHPVAVVSSLKRLGFTFDFTNLLEQSLLMDQRLERFRSEMEAALRNPGDIVGQGSVLWRIVYASIAEDQDRVSSMHVVRHEDLSLNPVKEYSRLYEALGMPLGAGARRTIARNTSERNPIEVSQKNPFKVRLDSRANLTNWKHRLEADEVERVLSITSTERRKFYDEASALPPGLDN
jgi:Sulfotransferase family